jgi:hypothetical protein
MAGAALETGLSCGHTIAQCFGFQWGKFVRPADAPRFHLVTLVSIVLGAGLVLTTLDPITVTEYSIVLSAAALPLTYFPILVVAVATIPLMILTKAGADRRGRPRPGSRAAPARPPARRQRRAARRW